jgi:hypothetical protein
MSAAAWPPDGPLTQWALVALESQGDEEAARVRREREEESRRVAQRAEDLRVVRDLHEVCGLCVWGLARELGVSCEVVRERLIAAGVPERRWR